jgi:hypothetical protein
MNGEALSARSSIDSQEVAIFGDLCFISMGSGQI